MIVSSFYDLLSNYDLLKARPQLQIDERRMVMDSLLNMRARLL
jgi:hypothetical protein